MQHYYVVVEYGDEFRGPYPTLYTSYEQAAAAVKAKHKEELDRQTAEMDGEPIASEVDVPENPSGTTDLYVEKGISIEIHKLPVKASSGGSRRRIRRNSRKHRA
jgi:hypothetical protein